ncbi:hypothetical protein CYMTET_39816 [Cymbomonas tetramitiformis]|uniref:USP domain-containing protein n=1 Tax=Cymbomonas tetramitiformis TaxID=36881 RepID=A0AAE0CAR2_9CHLO|nr:hypothetical protein CYMTET_39816 [Cymbomonas tetramitiformis]
MARQHRGLVSNVDLAKLRVGLQLAQSFLDNGACDTGRSLFRSRSIARAFGEVVKQLLGPGAATTYSPREFLNCISTWDRAFSGGRQHDSQEFLHSLLDALQTECNRVKGKAKYKELKGKGTEEQQADEAWAYAKSWFDSCINDIFGGQLQSTVVCQKCKNVTHCFDPFLDLSIPIPKNVPAASVDIHDCLRAFTETETLDGREQYRCENCKSPCTSTKKLSIYRLPLGKAPRVHTFPSLSCSLVSV